jgi:glucokinase
MDLTLAVDLGGTKIAGALVDRSGQVGPVRTVPTPAQDGPDVVVRAVGRLLEHVLHDGWPGGPEGVVATDGDAGTRVRAVGVGTAGVVDVPAGTIVSSTDTFTGWAGTHLGAEVRAAASALLHRDVPVHVQNDVDAHALGESWRGAAAGARSALVVAVGTGIGAGVVLDGTVLRGAHHVAGELGHLPIGGADHLRCPCGRPGHLEALGSGAGMRRHYAWLSGDGSVLDARGVVALAQAGDRTARQAVRESAAAVGRGIAAVVTVLDPEVVVVSGGVAEAGVLWWRPMEHALRAELVDVLEDVPVVPGRLGVAAPLLGAAASAWRLVDAA